MLVWMDLANSTVVPFMCMFILSIALIVCVYRSRMRSNSGSKRDNRFAISTIFLNIMFFVFVFPITFYDFSNFSNLMFNEIAFVWYFCYFALGFYLHLIVNRDFRNEFLRLFNLKVIRHSNSTQRGLNALVINTINTVNRK